MAREILKDSAILNEDARVVLNLQIRLVVEKRTDQQCENLPTSNQIANIIIDEYEEPCHCDIILMERQSGMENMCMKRINQNHTAYMPLHYILLFPHGEHGWHWGYWLNITRQDRQQDWVCQRAYYRYCFHTQKDENFPILHHSRRFFQQYIVDAWASCNLNTLTWLQHNQNQIVLICITVLWIPFSIMKMLMLPLWVNK